MSEAVQRVLAVIPAFREAGRIGKVVAALAEQGFEVLVVDDHSGDATAEEAAAAGAKVVRLPYRLGYGGALQTGYLYALARGYEAVVQLDGDGQHEPACARDVVGPILSGEADVVMGSRFLEDPDYPMPWMRRMGRRLFGGLAGLIVRRKVTDPTTGYQAVARKVLRLYASQLFPEDYPDADMLVMLHRMGFRVREVPVKMYPSPGASMHSGIVRPLYYLYKMTLAIFMALCRKLPRKDAP